MSTSKKTANGSVKNAKNPAASLIGKPAIVRSEVAGVHCGIVRSVDFKNSAVELGDAYRLWRVYTRDTTGSVSDIAAHGLKEPLSQHSIGARLETVVIVNPRGLEIAGVTDEAYASIKKAAAQ